MVTCTFICYSDIEIFTKYTLKKKYLSKAQNQIPHGLWISTCKVGKKNYRKKEKITLGCNYVISQRNRTLTVDIYFLTLPPACHKEEGVFLKAHTCM